jgi:hypothetical protein
MLSAGCSTKHPDRATVVLPGQRCVRLTPFRPILEWSVRYVRVTRDSDHKAVLPVHRTLHLEPGLGP